VYMTTDDLLIATTAEIDGRPVREYLGIVSGEATMRGVWTSGATRGGLKAARSPASQIERRVFVTRERAIAAMIEAAQTLGAMAIVGVEIRCSSIHRTSGNDMLLVTASGTAVTLW
jgi:uncharacterized protein YbjQ (UPF0145 family)